MKKTIWSVVFIASAVIVCAAVCAVVISAFSTDAVTESNPVYTINPVTGEMPTESPEADSELSLYDNQYNELKNNGYDVCIIFNTYEENNLALNSTHYHFTVISLDDFDCDVDSELVRKTSRNGKNKIFPEFHSVNWNEFCDKAEIKVLKDGKEFTSINLAFENKNTENGFTMLELVSADSDVLKVKFINMNMMDGSVW